MRQQNPRPIDAFEWLLDQFRLYTRNQITWLEVRRVLAEAEDYRDRHHHHRDKLLRRYDPAKLRHAPVGDES